MKQLKSTNIGVSFLLELALLVSVTYWGLNLDQANTTKWIITIVVLISVTVFWAMFMAPQSDRRFDVPLRYGVGLGLFLLGAVLLYAADRPAWAAVYAVVAIINVGLAALWKQ